MNVLVTGASGFVGNHLIGAFAEGGHTIRGLSRHMPKGYRRKDGVEYIDGVDVGDASTITPQMFAGIETVVHLVGIIQEARRRRVRQPDWEAKGGQTFQRIHVEGTRNVVDAAKKAGFIGRFIYMSAIGSDADAPAEYSRTKHAAEQIVINSGLPYTIFRPSLIMGKDGEFVAQMEELVKYGGLPIKIPFPVIPVPGSGCNLFQPIHIDDLTACVTGALADPKAANQSYELGGASQVTFNDLLCGFARALGVKKPMVHAPVPILKVVATVMEAVMPRPPVTRDQLANLGRDNTTQSHDITEVFDISPRGFDAILESIYTL